METKLIKIGNSYGVRIPKSLINQYGLKTEIDIEPTANGILISSKKKAREGWAERIDEAIKADHLPDDELLEGFTDDFTENQWQW